MKNLLASLLVHITCFVSAQTILLQTKCTLPDTLNETSGLAITNRNSIWSHNDSGGKPELYNFDTLGNLLRIVQISNATNHDWEDLAQDPAGNIYIGDFGNNSNDRTNLRIYKIPDPNAISGNAVAAGKINFTYPDQQAFPPPPALQNFDMEAMIAYDNYLYLFSKNRTNPYTGYTKLYRLPNTPGTHVATLIDSFYTGGAPDFTSFITAADISPDGTELILLSSGMCWLFTDFTGDNFFAGTARKFQFNLFTQKEAVSFVNNNEIYITDEYGSGTGQKLYYANLLPVLFNSMNEVRASSESFEWKITGLTLEIKSSESEKAKVLLYNFLGQKVFETEAILLSNEWVKVELPQSNSFVQFLSISTQKTGKKMVQKLSR
jgi:hypothetical protein